MNNEAYKKKLDDIQRLETDKQKLDKEYRQQLTKQNAAATNLNDYAAQAKNEDTLGTIENDPTYQELTKTLKETKQKEKDLNANRKVKSDLISQANREAENLLKEIKKLENEHQFLSSKSES